MTNVEKLLNKYEEAVNSLLIAIKFPALSPFTVKGAVEMVEKARAKVLKAMKGEGNEKG